MLNNKDSYSTTNHFKERLYERFLVKENSALDWAREFFNNDPELLNDTRDGNQRWTNGNIVVAIDTKRHNYVTAYPVSGEIELDYEVYQKVNEAIESVIEERTKEYLESVSAIKNDYEVDSDNAEESLEKFSNITNEIFEKTEKLTSFKKNSRNLISDVKTINVPKVSEDEPLENKTEEHVDTV